MTRTWLPVCLLVGVIAGTYGQRGGLNPLGSLGSLGSFGSVGSRLNPLNVGTQAWDQTFGKLTNTSSSDIAKRFTENSIPGVRHRIITDVPLGGHKLAEVFQDANDTVLDCNLLGDKVLIEGALAVIPESLLTKVTPEEMEYFLDLCHNRDPNAKKSGLKSFFEFIGDIFKSLFIFPGTKWCGAGDVAKNYDDLGTNKATDMCCRAHDHSGDSIEALKTKHGITNTNLYTMTNCKDDRKFYNCLLNDSSLPSAAVGKLFFNVLRTQCFDYTYPKKCVNNNQFYLPLLTEKCKEYKLDDSEPKKWQTFSPPNFAKDYMNRKRMQTSSTVSPIPAQNVPETGVEHPSVPVTTEEPEEEAVWEEEPDTWNLIEDSDISLDATEEPVYDESQDAEPTKKPLFQLPGPLGKSKLFGNIGK